MCDSIYTLFARVKEHPDFAGGTIFTRADVADAVFEPEDGWDDEPDVGSVAKVTDDMLSQAEDVIDSYIFSGAYSWREALRENVEVR